MFMMEIRKQQRGTGMDQTVVCVIMIPEYKYGIQRDTTVLFVVLVVMIVILEH